MDDITKNKLELFNSYYSLEAEQSVLGAILIDSNCLDWMSKCKWSNN